MMNKPMPKCDMIVDLQYGSTGKGLIAGYLANEHEYTAAVTANMPNAGHTYICKDGVDFMHKVMPNAAASPSVKTVFIGPGAVFSMERLAEEVKYLDHYGYYPNVFIHENAVVLKEAHKKAEDYASAIGSTQQGSGAAMIDKIERNTDRMVIARDVVRSNTLPSSCCIVSPKFYWELMSMHSKILLEGAQGFSLGINERFYPYCTSRDCTPARFMADMAVPLPWLNKVVGVARVHPIRVGGTSGGCYPDQRETSWEELDLPVERTTVTQRVRRVFTFSDEQINDAIRQTMPDEVFLNFCNYDEGYAMNVKRRIQGALDGVQNGRVKYLGWGPTHHNVEEL